MTVTLVVIVAKLQTVGVVTAHVSLSQTPTQLYAHSYTVCSRYSV